ncbi:hypothetical protein [Paracoccus fontiphilus]|uniref:Uncharacterized protein n=1 Tax=Paracoccus fontiphilus TaxID=1815556 RepID=A0ABV7IEJ8_9RHOB|nr:hypothetical protein [Paracoccus fontiphilus]
MEIIIKATDAVEYLEIISPRTGLNYIEDFIGNTGALVNGEFTWDEEREAYLADQKVFDWWQEMVTIFQALEYRLHDLREEHGEEAVWNVTQTIDDPELPYFAGALNAALDAKFGEEAGS